jgi:hypothetical protein
MKDLLFFEKLVTPKFITFIYWLMLAGIVIGGIYRIFGGYGGVSVSKFFMGLVFIVLGAVGVRVWCELLIVLFKMNEALQDIRNK